MILFPSIALLLSLFTSFYQSNIYTTFYTLRMDEDGAREEKIYTSKDYTLVFCRRLNPTTSTPEILLGMKKRGFGQGKWNGFGGKLEEGETIEQAAKRELQEECGIVANSLQRMGYLVFKMLELSKLMYVHVYQTYDFEKEEMESEEMKPQWYTEDQIPFPDMWADDAYWLPLLLQNKSFVGRFEYEDDETIVEHSIREG